MPITIHECDKMIARIERLIPLANALRPAKSYSYHYWRVELEVWRAIRDRLMPRLVRPQAS